MLRPTCPSADKIVNYVVSAVTVRAGAIDITFGNRANSVLKGKILTLRPAVIDDAPVVPVTWVCGYAAAPDKMTSRARTIPACPRETCRSSAGRGSDRSRMRTIEAGPLMLEPQTAGHAEEMFAVLGDPAIYSTRTRRRPRSTGCAHRYEKLEAGDRPTARNSGSIG